MEKKIEVGDYIKDIYSRIGKIKSYSNGTYFTEKFGASSGEIVKHSKNIIDLIEEGDYVNGHKVEVIWEDADNYRFGGCDYMFQITGKEIKSIVTKEQMEAIQYVIE